MGHIIAELRKRGTFGGFGGERMQSLLEGMWNKSEYAFKDSHKLSGQLEECSNSKGMQSVEIKDFKIIFWGR